MECGAGGVWAWADSASLHGVYYDYRVTVNDVSRDSADPYGRACGRNGLRSMAVDLSQTNPKGWRRMPRRPGR